MADAAVQAEDSRVVCAIWHHIPKGDALND